MIKSERDDLFLQQQVFDKITKTARDEDDFSIHMIEEFQFKDSRLQFNQIQLQVLQIKSLFHLLV